MDFIERESCGVRYLTAPNITAPHAFTTRAGGVSEGIYSSLNLGERLGDEPERVRENYRRLGEALGIGRLVFTRQVHGDRVRPVTGRDAREPYDPPPEEADGLITCEEGLSLIVFVADCIPILLHDPVRGCVGAVHAGWRGTVADIAGKAVAAMTREYGTTPADIRAAIGPGISRCSFETGAEVPEAVRAVLGGDGDEFIAPSVNAGRFMVDLKGVNRALLIRAGLEPENIAVSDDCTFCLSDKYWSHRKTRGERGSQAAVITLGGKEQ